ncbi:MAG: ArsR family transcriptional regulator [Xanthomonadaceae bacterium]|nr:ArsR family transcriptional regulator [Xanthomonadaceae bacterium]MBU6476748.1 ArsR family transcriptional regulator [Xanthomonadaceae bacterium]MDE2054501.1 ArsR family transcriptional regulator [Xanthomonadaceae bacterium]
MRHASALRQLGGTQQKLLRKLLLSPQGATVEELCRAIGITHNAVRQHLTALMAQGLVARGESIPSGGRPRACFVLRPAGRELFPRNYALIAGGVLEYLYAHEGTQAVQAMLAEMGAKLGRDASERIAAATGPDEVTRLLAEQLDTLGYEAQVVEVEGHAEVEAWNCVFHSLAKTHPDVCRFDLAFMSAATGRPVQRTQCMLHGAPACRFHVADAQAKTRDV